MDLQIEFKKKIYAQIAEQFNCNAIKHSVAHGIDYENDHYGRDADILIQYKNRKVARKIIYSIFEQNKIQYKNNIFLWVDCIIGYKTIEDRILFIEIDLLYHNYYRCFELTSNKGLSINKVNTDYFYIDYWNMYAKAVLTKFIGLDFCKLSDRQLKEVTRIAHLYAHRIDANGFFSDELLNNLNQAIINNDIKRISHLKSEFKAFKIIKKNPLKSFVIFLKCSAYFLQRKIKAFGIIPVIIVSDKAVENIKQITTLLDESFFTKVNITNETLLNTISIRQLLNTYIKLKKKSDLLILNIVVLNDRALKTMSSNFLSRFILKFFNILVIRAEKENYQTNDMLLQILEQTVRK
jgi:hypothetical protein